MKNSAENFKVACGAVCFFLFIFVQMAFAGAIIPGTACEAFPDDSWWHADVSKLPTHVRSARWLSHMSSGASLYPDFGPPVGTQTAASGIPVNIVDGTHPRVAVEFANAEESDHVRYPLGKDLLIEAGPNQGGERRTIVVRTDTCQVYETRGTRLRDGKWTARSGATWSLKSNALRPRGWVSADKAGLPLIPGLLGYEETADHNIDHAIRFTTKVTDRSYLWPARRGAGTVNNDAYPPMGARFRLKSSYVIGKDLRADTKAVLRAMKHYGLVLADYGQAWHLQGTADNRWPQAFLNELKQVPAAAFEAVDTESFKIVSSSMTVAPLAPDVLAEGDSISVFWGGNHTGIYAAARPNVRYRDVAVGGSSLSDSLSGNGLVQRQPADLSHHPKVLTVFIGANDLGSFPSGKAYAEAIFAYAAPFRAAGTKVAVATILARKVPQSPAYDVIHNFNRIKANELIRAAVGQKIDAVIDFAADPTMGTDSAPLNKDLFSDGLHPTDGCGMGCGGQGKLAVIYKNALDTLLSEVNP